MSLKTWNEVTHGAIVAFASEAWVGSYLWFAPGWANGWPGGLTIHTVWSTGMAGLLFLLTLTLAVGVGAAVGSLCNRSEVGYRWGQRIFAAWLVAATILAFAMSYVAFAKIYASTLEMWPKAAG
ncbi:MAG: hypothetical protein FD138_4507 [Planctomycetota bacterium]|nr:MAG: hypothetical protein FD138_4507 [Planctomycetota bacterium]